MSTISVVIPTYNQPKLLLETLASVFSQTRPADEIIVINDGSTDDTLAHLQPWVESGKIRVVTQANQGIGAARNRGLLEARGDYIALLDHDDLWHADKLAVQTEYLERHPDIVAATCRWEYNIRPGRCVFNVERVAGADGIIQAPYKAFADREQFVITSGILLRAAALRGIGYCETRGGIEDISFYMQLFQRGGIGIAGDRILMTYRLHESNASKQASYFAMGVRELRRLDHESVFDKVTGEDRLQMHRHFAANGRIGVSLYLSAKERRKAMELYFDELPFQIRDRAWRYLLGFWAMLLFPVIGRCAVSLRAESTRA